MQRFPALGLYSKLGLCNIWFYSGFGLDKFSCTYLLVRENRLLQNLNKTKIWIFFCQIFLNISDNFGKYEVFRFKRNQMHFFYFSFVLLREYWTNQKLIFTLPYFYKISIHVHEGRVEIPLTGLTLHHFCV